MFVLDRVISHRGASAYAPENTLVAFNAALALGCRLVEFDVMLNADGEPFIFHDETLKRTTNGQGEFGFVSTAYLQSLDAGLWFSKRFRGARIPTFQDVLTWLINSNANANIEIKPYPGFTTQTTMAVLAELKDHWPTEKPLPLVSSFDVDALALCCELAPEIPLGLLLDKWSDDWLSLARERNCFSVHLNERVVTQARVRAIKQHGFKVCVYTVNRKRQATHLFNWGVDAVFSNYPDLLTRSIYSRIFKKDTVVLKSIS